MPHTKEIMKDRKYREKNNHRNAHSHSRPESNAHHGIQSRSYCSYENSVSTYYLDRNEGWSGPVISDSELLKIGSEEDILKVSGMMRVIAFILLHDMYLCSH